MNPATTEDGSLYCNDEFNYGQLNSETVDRKKLLLVDPLPFGSHPFPLSMFAP